MRNVDLFVSNAAKKNKILLGASCLWNILYKVYIIRSAKGAAILCAYIIRSAKGATILCADGTPLAWVDSVRYFGVLLYDLVNLNVPSTKLNVPSLGL